MRLHILSLLCLALLLSTGCEKMGGGRSRGEIKFKAAAPNSALTKAAWGEDVGTQESGTQRIVWETGDVIRLASNYAQTDPDLGAPAHWFDYAVSSVDAGSETKYSYGKLSPYRSLSGLMWDSSRTRAEHKFWGVYPARDITVNDGEARISGNLPDDDILMVSYLDSAPESAVSLYFYPAFTELRFKITNGTGVPVTVNSISISSGSPLQGKFNARIVDGGVEDIQMESEPTPEPDPEAPVSVWEGEILNSGDGVGTHDAFKEALVGQWIRIHFNVTGSYNWYYIQPYGGQNGWDPLLVDLVGGNGDINMSNYPVEPGVDTYFQFTITEDILSKIYVPEQADWAKGWTYAMRIQFGNCTITKVEYGGAAEPAAGQTGTKGAATKAAGPKLAVTNEVAVNLNDNAEMESFSDFVVLPRDITDLRLTVNYTAEGQGTFTKSMNLSDVTFDAGKQYRLVGIILPDALDIVDISVVSNGQVLHTGRDTWKF